jgi:hypothetical protein
VRVQVVRSLRDAHGDRPGAPQGDPRAHGPHRLGAPAQGAGLPTRAALRGLRPRDGIGDGRLRIRHVASYVGEVGPVRGLPAFPAKAGSSLDERAPRTRKQRKPKPIFTRSRDRKRLC